MRSLKYRAALLALLFMMLPRPGSGHDGLAATESVPSHHRQSPSSQSAEKHSALPKQALDPVYLPLAISSAPAPCAPVGRPPLCESERDTGWTAICGGFGRIRDIITANDGRIFVVGDGTAELGWFAGASGRPSWDPQLGTDLTGLNNLDLANQQPTTACPLPPCGWAVGERDLIARCDGGCWSTYEGGTNRAVELRSVSVTQRNEGWAVGLEQGAAGEHAALARHNTASTGWSNQAADALALPPLTDVQTLIRFSQELTSWAVGCNRDGTGWFARAEPSWHWLLVESTDACPRELAMVDAGAAGWAFGTERGEESLSLVSWRYDEATGWRESPFRLQGQELVDVYLHVTADGETELWLGVTPAEEAPVLYRSSGGRVMPAPVGSPDDSVRLADSDGNRAVAALVDGRALYALGDDVWLLDQPPSEWSKVRSRERLVDLAPAAAGHWLLATAPGGSSLFTLDREGLRPAVALGAQSGLLPPLAALDSRDGRTWAVGERGASLVVSGGMGRWRWVTSPGDGIGDFRDVTVLPDGVPWAAGAGADGHGRLWRYNGSDWSEMLRTQAPTGLTAIAYTPDGTIWAVGHQLVVAHSVDCDPQRGEPCSLERVVAARLEDVAAVGTDEAWAVGDHVLVVNRWSSFRYDELRLPDQSLALRHGARLVAIDAASPEDVWAGYLCCEDTHEPGREYTTILRYDGSWWTPSTTLSVPAAGIVSEDRAGQRTAWLVGDWSTVARLEYAAEPSR